MFGAVFQRTALLSAAAAIIAVSALNPFHAAAAADDLISLSRPAVASSLEGASTPANAVDDGDLTTRWSSLWSDPQWIRLDLGATATIHKVVLHWEAAYASGYQLQTSPDGNAWTTIYSTTTGTGGVQSLDVNGSGRYIRMNGTSRGTGYGYSLNEFQVYGSVSLPAGTGYVLANPQVTGVTPSAANPAPAYFHEFQAGCAADHMAMDDPIVYPGQPGASHDHTFMGNVTTNAFSTLATLQAGGTTCNIPADRSGYWMPTVYNGNQMIMPVGPQVIYYKTGIIDYTSVRPFPPGLRFVVGSPSATANEFKTAPGWVAGWECGSNDRGDDFPANCPAGTQLNIRYQAPSCWNGLYLDTPDHKSHMAYPVNGRCPADHPVALPMIEFKMAFPVSGDMSQVHLASGRGYSFHYDFFNAWEDPTLKALVDHCIVGGLQCDGHGFDQNQPSRGATLNAQYRLP
jgi:hypothetical protein